MHHICTYFLLFKLVLLWIWSLKWISLRVLLGPSQENNTSKNHLTNICGTHRLNWQGPAWWLKRLTFREWIPHLKGNTSCLLVICRDEEIKSQYCLSITFQRDVQLFSQHILIFKPKSNNSKYCQGLIEYA